MKSRMLMCSSVMWMLLLAVCAGESVCGADALTDWRNVRNGYEIPDQNYVDQPYIVVMPDGSWVCTLTTGPGGESNPGQHVVATISRDKGRTWSQLIDIEPSGGPRSSWVVPVVLPNGRIYAFYNYDEKEVDLPIPTVNGPYCYRYSDDGGRTWSKDRYYLPVRQTAVDRNNKWGGEIQMFWGIDKPIIRDGKLIFAFSKLGRYIVLDGEGWFFTSENILTERDPNKIVWTMLPETDGHGVMHPDHGPVQEEHNVEVMNNGDWYVMYRTTRGYPMHAYSRDAGRTWEPAEPATYTPGGRVIKHPRACPMIWKLSNGKYVFWFHNHGGKSYQGRNPVWLSGGIEKDGYIHWSEPEIVLWDPDTRIQGMSYPDLFEDGGRIYLTETQKKVARVREIDQTLLQGMWAQGESRELTRKGLVYTWDGNAAFARAPRFNQLTQLSGFTVDMRVRFDDLSAGQVLLDTRDESGKGIAITTTDKESVQITFNDGEREGVWDCDPGIIRPGQEHHITINVDTGPKIIMFVVDGQLCDGGTARTHGWGRFDAAMRDVNGSNRMSIAPSLNGKLTMLRIYNRCLRNSEAIANYHHDSR